ncbi:MAG: hypothetical protein M5U05_09675 [Anaerolineales bacterium]|nr:hypothetical protein [Anaerolineales bacterium]
MPVPNLTFFCELDSAPLASLLNNSMIDDLKTMRAGVSMGLRDLSSERAEIVKDLNKAGVPLVAWLLLPKEEGYWFNLRNAPQATRRYLEFRGWTEKHGLKWAAIGLDIEPDVREMEDLANRNWRLIPSYLVRAFARFEYKRGLLAYRRLVSQIHADGYLVESYQFPLIEDERKARSTLLQRVFGLVNLAVDREVWMLYTSHLRPYGAGILGSYAEDAQAIAVGSTGGGVDIHSTDIRPLSWDELTRDLRLAWYSCNDIYIFSLEGCAQQGYIEKLKQLRWDYPVILPETSMQRVDGWRRSLQSVLWLFSHLAVILGIVLGIFVAWRAILHWWSGRNRPNS